MKIKYYGHAFWSLDSAAGRIVIDPFDDIGYPMPKDLSADYILVSHDHHDHCNTSLIKGRPTVIRKEGEHSFPNLKVTLIPVYHDANKGAMRGRNHLIMVETEGLKIVHCGDLGHLPDADIRRQIDNPDVLFIPVGEIYTLSLGDVKSLIDDIKPTLIIPMHYMTTAVNFRLGALDAFLPLTQNAVKVESNQVEITPELLSESKTLILDWKE